MLNGPAEPLAPQDCHWSMPLTIRIGWAGTASVFTGIFAGKAADGGVLAVAIAVPVVLISLWGVFVVRLWRAGVWLTSTAATADTVIVRHVLTPSRGLAAAQILNVESGDLGLKLTTMDGRLIVATALPADFSRSTDAKRAIRAAAMAARARHPEQAAADIELSAPVRALRAFHRALWLATGGPAGLALSFTPLFSGDHHGARHMQIMSAAITIWGIFNLYAKARRLRKAVKHWS